MVSSRWQRQNPLIMRLGFMTIIVLWFVGPLILPRNVLNPLFSTAILVVGLPLLFVLKNRNAKEMVRVLKFDYEAIERDFRVMFKDNHIRFLRKTEEESYYYEFPGYDLIMTAKPYIRHNLGFEREIQTPATHIALHEVTSNNREFAERLAKSIDEMAIQLTSLDSKAYNQSQVS